MGPFGPCHDSVLAPFSGKIVDFGHFPENDEISEIPKKSTFFKKF